MQPQLLQLAYQGQYWISPDIWSYNYGYLLENTPQFKLYWIYGGSAIVPFGLVQNRRDRTEPNVPQEMYYCKMRYS